MHNLHRLLPRFNTILLVGYHPRKGFLLLRQVEVGGFKQFRYNSVEVGHKQVHRFVNLGLLHTQAEEDNRLRRFI